MVEITAKITLKNGNVITFGKESIKNIESLSQNTTNNTSPYYGIVASSGSLHLLDIDGSIENYIKKGLIDSSGLEIEFYINNHLFQRHISMKDGNNYDVNERILTLALSNIFQNWRSITFPFRQLSDECSAFDLLVEIFEFLGYDETNSGEVTSMCSEETLLLDNLTFGTIKELLQDITIEYPYLQEDTVYNQIDKICRLALLQCYQDDNGNIKFSSNRKMSKDNIIKIPKNKQYSQFDYNLIVNNKISSVSYKDIKCSYDYKEVFSNSATFYNQTKSASGGDYLFYSGLLSDYSKNIKTNSNNYTIIDIYPVYRNNAIDTSQYYVLYKAKFTSKEISKENQWLAFLSNSNRNIFPLSQLSPTSNTKYFLLNENYIDNFYNSISEDFVWWYTLVDTESEALHNLCHYSGNTIDSIYYSSDIDPTSPPPSIQIIKEGEDFVFYYIALVVSKMGSQISHYTGDLYYIMLDSTLSIRQKVLTQNLIKTENENAKMSLIDSELLNRSTEYKNIQVPSLNSRVIVYDWEEGLSNGTITLSFGDYYDENGTKIINGISGELLHIGNIIQIEGNDKVWRITGRKFRKKGTPFLDLDVVEVENVKDLSFYTYLSFGNSKKYIGSDFYGISIVASNTTITNGNIPEKVIYTDLGDNEHLVYIYMIEAGGFLNCTSIENVTIPSKMENIDTDAFRGCSSLKTVTINSKTIYDSLTSQTACGRLIYSAETINILASIDDGSNTYLTNNYTLEQITIDGIEYNSYTTT